MCCFVDAWRGTPRDDTLRTDDVLYAARQDKIRLGAKVKSIKVVMVREVDIIQW